MKKLTSLLLLTITLASCNKGNTIKYTYGVFLGCDHNDVTFMNEYQKVVLDAQEFDKENITYLNDKGITVYSYLNVGSIETYRDYYNDFKDITIGEYEHWEDERWIDVTSKDWQSFITGLLSSQLLDKGVDGFFIDNLDIYYEMDEDEKVFIAIKNILSKLKERDVYIIINGADTFVSECINRQLDLSNYMDAVNQETVFTKIDWDNNTYGPNDEEETEYYLDYLQKVKNEDIDIYLLEYGNSSSLIKKVKDYCTKENVYYYFSDTIELVINGSTSGSQKIK